MKKDTTEEMLKNLKGRIGALEFFQESLKKELYIKNMALFTILGMILGNFIGLLINCLLAK